MTAYTLKFSHTDAGDPDCKERKDFDNYIKSFWMKGCQIQTNIKIYEILVSKEADNIFKFSNHFFTQSIYNSFALATIELAAFFSESSDTASIHKFLNFCEQNQKKIFTKKFYEEKINVPDSKTKVDMGNFSEILNETRQILSDNQEYIELLKNDRDQVFAHFDKKFLVTKQKQVALTVEKLQKGLSLMEIIINKIGIYYDRSIRSFEPIGITDIDNIISIINFYVNNKKQIGFLKRNGTLK